MRREWYHSARGSPINVGTSLSGRVQAIRGAVLEFSRVVDQCVYLILVTLAPRADTQATPCWQCQQPAGSGAQSGFIPATVDARLPPYL